MNVWLNELEIDFDDVVVCDKDGVTDVLEEPEVVCDGDGPLGVALKLHEQVNVLVNDNDEEKENENDELPVIVVDKD